MKSTSTAAPNSEIRLSVAELAEVWIAKLIRNAENSVAFSRDAVNFEPNAYSVNKLAAEECFLGSLKRLPALIPSVWTELLVRNPDPARAVCEAVETWAQARTPVNGERYDD